MILQIQRSTGVNGRMSDAFAGDLGWYRRASAPWGKLSVPPFCVLTVSRMCARNAKCYELGQSKCYGGQARFLLVEYDAVGLYKIIYIWEPLFYGFLIKYICN